MSDVCNAIVPHRLNFLSDYVYYKSTIKNSKIRLMARLCLVYDLFLNSYL